MSPWLEMGLSNGMAATLLAVAAALATRFCRRPQVAFALWLLVLAKLLTPAFFSLPLGSLRPYVALDAGPDLAPVADRAAVPADDWLVTVPMLEMTPQWSDSEPQDQDLEPKDIEALAAGELLPHNDGADLGEPELNSEDVLFEPNFADEMPAAELPDEELFADEPAELLAAALPARTLPPSTFAFESEPTHEPALRRWFGIAAWAWLAGSVLWCLLAAVRVVRFARLVRRAEPAGKELRDEVRRLARRMGLARVARRAAVATASAAAGVGHERPPHDAAAGRVAHRIVAPTARDPVGPRAGAPGPAR